MAIDNVFLNAWALFIRSLSCSFPLQMELDDSNKVAIFNAGGVSTLATRLKSAPDPQERGLVAAVLWNLSACEEIKPHLLEVC